MSNDTTNKTTTDDLDSNTAVPAAPTAQQEQGAEASTSEVKEFDLDDIELIESKVFA